MNDGATDDWRLLYLFSGPSRPLDGLATFAEELGGSCTCMDIEIDESHDLVDLNAWEAVYATLQDYDAYMMAPPCSTFTPARNADDGGPKPLRAASGPDRYGFRNLDKYDKQKVQEGNVLAIRSSQTGEFASDHHKPWMLEQPHRRPGKTSMLNLDEIDRLLTRPDVRIITLAQCRFGAEAEKLTDLVTNIAEEDTRHLQLLCNHPSQWWIIPWSGEKVFSPHPPLKGTQRAIPLEEWSPAMLRKSAPRGPFLTRAAAAYPSALNRALAETFKKALSRRSLQRIRTNPVAVEDQPGHGLTDAKVTMSLPLRGQVAGSDIDDKNSLRNISKSVGNKMMYVGKQLSNLIERELDRHPMIQQRLLANIGKPLEEVDQVEEWMDNLRLDMKQLLTRNSGNINMQEQLDIEPINNRVYATCIRGHLLKFWAEVVEDPGSKVAQWLIEGAPAGMTVGTDDLDHVCPRVDVDDTDCFDPSVLSTDFDEFENYFGVETDHDASKAITQYFEKGYLKCFDTLDQLREFVGGQPILSKLGCIKKLKYNADTQAYTHKVRIILDCKQSKVSTSSRRTHKSILPRVSDAVQSALSLSADLRNDELLRGSQERIDRLTCIIVVGWMLLGFPLAFHKAVLSTSVQWIGIQLTVAPECVKAVVPESKVAELKELLLQGLENNVIPVKTLRTIIGKAMAIASVIYVWRPFVQEMYSAIHCVSSHAPRNCVWTRQVSIPFRWILAFLSGEHAGIVRVYSLSHFRKEGPEVIITWDASPWGMGATLQVAGQFVQFFAIRIDELDEEVLKTKSGGCEGQQVWEALAGLVALRLWARFWTGQRARLHVRGDNMGALTLFSTLKASSPALSLISREFALDLGTAEYRPDLIQHIPGIVNKITDALSRRYQPGTTFELPKLLLKAKPVIPVRRDMTWWRSLQGSKTPAEPKVNLGRGTKRQLS